MHIMPPHKVRRSTESTVYYWVKRVNYNKNQKVFSYRRFTRTPHADKRRKITTRNKKKKKFPQDFIKNA